MNCPVCGKEMKVQLVAEKKKRGIIATFLWLFVCFCTCFLILLIPALRGSKTKTRKYFVCDNCGYSTSKKLK